MASSSNNNPGRHARTALMDIYKAERSWDGWNSDGITITNDLVNLLLQAHNSQEPAVWHPTLPQLFPDVAEKFLTTTLITARHKIDQLQHKITMMNRQIDRIDAASELLIKLLPPKGSSVEFVEPLLFGSVTWYAELAQRVEGAYRAAVDMRVGHIAELEKCIEGFESVQGGARLDSDEQLVKLSYWLHSPGLKNAILLDTTSTLMLSDFDELVRMELGIEQI
ncbi:hypothetical protein BX661DRAFT_178833 [Kickxella alabastrina]|uniref:uncharacterized protein n=1 Tax=Kickxella alabastrina TaxID=61397 RepID=UPI0022208801|nr:uncharacterized protein BX661DRAFT_178833 [Kickxella alabastrina]KAI7832943.1 hypothetical protein BX661DRAFT_178833 [Kickxella alabastrina]